MTRPLSLDSQPRTNGDRLPALWALPGLAVGASTGAADGVVHVLRSDPHRAPERSHVA